LLRFEIGNALPDPKNPETVEVKGRDLIMGIPKVLSIDSEEIRIIQQIWTSPKLWISCLMMKFGRVKNLLDVLTQYEILEFCRLD